MHHQITSVGSTPFHYYSIEKYKDILYETNKCIYLQYIICSTIAIKAEIVELFEANVLYTHYTQRLVYVYLPSRGPRKNKKTIAYFSALASAGK